MSLLHPGLLAFTAIIKYKTVHAAAKAINLTQTGVTQRIRALEKTLQVTLFTRSRKGMIPTQEGVALARYCKQVLDMEGELLSFMQGETQIRITITGPSSLMRGRIIPNTINITDEYPDLLLNYVIRDDLSALTMLKTGETNFAVIHRQEVVNEIDSKLLNPETYILAAPPSWKGRNLKEIIANEHIIDFNPSDTYTFDYLKKYQLSELPRKERHYVNNIDALISMIQQGRGYSVLARDLVNPLLERNELIKLNSGQSMQIEYALAWYPRHQAPKYFLDLIKKIK